MVSALMKLTIKCSEVHIIYGVLQTSGITTVISKCFKGRGTWYYEIQIMKDFGFWVLHLSSSITLTSFAKVSKAGKCHLSELFGDLKKLEENEPVTTFRKKEKHSVYWVINRVHSSHGCRLGNTWKYLGTGHERNTQGNTVRVSYAPTGSWALIQVIRPSFTCFWRQAEERNGQKFTQICLTFSVLGRLSDSITLACKLFQALAD